MTPSFIHLRLHSEYSLVDGLVDLKALVGATAKQGMPAVAVTDQCNLFALVKFYKAALGKGVKPIAGVDLWLRNEEDTNAPFRLLLLVQDRVGYNNLTRLVSRGYREGQHLGRAMVERGWLEGNTDGLIALSGGRDGDVGRALLSGNADRAEALLADWRRLFPDRYLSGGDAHRPAGGGGVSPRLGGVGPGPRRAGGGHQRCALSGAGGFRGPRGAGLHPRGAHPGGPAPAAHLQRSAVSPLPRRDGELFADLPEALENSVEIARRCNIELTLGKNFLPDFPIPEGLTIDDFFRLESEKGMAERLQVLLSPDAPDYAERGRPMRSGCGSSWM
jgi:DNA polymerase III subunit alpha